jgi:dTDP-4-amino-4,6-dideoxygalactose transaminase
MTEKIQELPFVPYARASIGEDEIAEVVATLRSGWLSMGPRTKQFEEEFAAYVGAPHAISVNSCTSGLFLLMHTLGLAADDEVITTPMTFAASANVIVHAGAKPVFADVSPVNWCLDPAKVAEAVTPRTKAIVVVHYAGAVVDMEAIEKIAGNNIRIIEDCAHAVGSRYKDGSRVGSRHPAAFSFYATKNMTSGEGGMITVHDAALATRLRALRLHGITQDAWKRYSKEGSWYYEVEEHGYKMNLTDINSAIGLHQLRKVEGFNARRREIAKQYDDAFKDLPV